MSSIRIVASLILALTVLQLAQGMLGVQLPLAMAAARFSETRIGFVGAAYSAGFMAGAWLGPTYLVRIGHIRLFAAAAAIAATTTLAVHWTDGVLGWMANRFATGAAVALLFAAGESWMNGSIKPHERGSLIGFYQVCAKAALAIGPFLVFAAPPGAPEPLMAAAILLCLSMIPVCFTSRAQPELAHVAPLSVLDLYRLAPAAAVACFGSGLINSGLLTLAPIYANDRFGAGAAAGFQAAAWTGSMILQWPAGRLSDRVDRRLVIGALLGLAGVSALALAAFDHRLAFWQASALFALWGAGSLSFYGVGVAHMADRAGPAQIARATSGILFIWAIGSVAGPAALGMLADVAGKSAIFWYAGAVSLLIVAVMVWRRRARATAPSEARAALVNEPIGSLTAAELAYGEDAKSAN
jgi:MFS family permease